MTIEIHRPGGAVGSATVLTRNRFARLIATAGSSPRILLDLSGMTLVDSAGPDVPLDPQSRIVDAPPH